MATPHNNARMGDIAKTVLMPGDPLRVEYIAKKYMEDTVCFNKVRGMLGYTGTYKGRKISVKGKDNGRVISDSSKTDRDLYLLWEAAWECRLWVYTVMNCIKCMMWTI